jgi:hypothetical protein
MKKFKILSICAALLFTQLSFGSAFAADNGKIAQATDITAPINGWLQPTAILIAV